MDVLISVLALLLWIPCAWSLFRIWFGTPRQFLENWKNRRGSESQRYIREGIWPALVAQAFEVAVMAFLFFNVMMWVVCTALVSIIFGWFGFESGRS